MLLTYIFNWKVKSWIIYILYFSTKTWNLLNAKVCFYVFLLFNIYIQSVKYYRVICFRDSTAAISCVFSAKLFHYFERIATFSLSFIWLIFSLLHVKSYITSVNLTRIRFCIKVLSETYNIILALICQSR